MHPIVALAVLGLVLVRLWGSLAELAATLLVLALPFLLLRGAWRAGSDLRRMGRGPRR